MATSLFFFACVVLRFCRIFLAYNLSKMASAKDDYRSHPDRWSTRVSLELQNVSAPTHFGVNNKLPPRWCAKPAPAIEFTNNSRPKSSHISHVPCGSVWMFAFRGPGSLFSQESTEARSAVYSSFGGQLGSVRRSASAYTMRGLDVNQRRKPTWELIRMLQSKNSSRASCFST